MTPFQLATAQAHAIQDFHGMNMLVRMARFRGISHEVVEQLTRDNEAIKQRLKVREYQEEFATVLGEKETETLRTNGGRQ